ncbi:MAG: hypothetical protein ACTHM6_13785 [Tepidisphaeraceae bacterium]
MDLVSAAVNFKQATTMSQVQYAVAAKILHAQKDQGNAALQLLNAASQTAGNAGDQMVAAATGLGGSLDVRG